MGRAAPRDNGVDRVRSSVVKLSMRALWLKDRPTYEHSIGVARYAAATGRALGLDRATVKRLWLASLLHDVGKLYLPDRLLQTSGVLDTAEFDQVREHAVVGFELMRVVPELAPYLEAIRHHHERWDGTGYPDGLARAAIPLEGRVIAVADAFDVMVRGRAYRAPRSPLEAGAELKKQAGTQFDPAVVEALLAAWKAGKLVNAPTASNGPLSPTDRE